MKNSAIRWICSLLICTVFLAMAAASSSESSGTPKEITGSTGGSASDSASNSQTSAEPVTIEEQVLFDRDGVVVTAKEYTQDSIWGDGIKLLVENNRDENITVSCRDLIVNHYMVSNLFSCDVAAGKKVNKDLNFSSSDLKAAGIGTVAEVEASFHVYNADTWDTIFDTDLVGIKTSEYGQVEYLPNDAGKELYNGGGIRIVGKYVDEDSIWGTAILLYVENNSDQKIVVQARDLSVNGFMLTPLFSCTVYPGRMAVDDITLLSSEMEQNGIESVQDVELSFHITDESFFNTIADTGPVSFTVENP